MIMMAMIGSDRIETEQQYCCKKKEGKNKIKS